MLYHKTIPIEHIHSCLRIVQAACEGEITYDLAERKRKEDIMGKKKQMRCFEERSGYQLLHWQNMQGWIGAIFIEICRPNKW